MLVEPSLLSLARSVDPLAARLATPLENRADLGMAEKVLGLHRYDRVERTVEDADGVTPGGIKRVKWDRAKEAHLRRIYTKFATQSSNDVRDRHGNDREPLNHRLGRPVD